MCDQTQRSARCERVLTLKERYLVGTLCPPKVEATPDERNLSITAAKLFVTPAPAGAHARRTSKIRSEAYMPAYAVTLP